MKKRTKIILISAAALLAALVAGFMLYVSDYYRADDIAVEALAGDVSIRTDGNVIILSPPTPGDTALIFYPGGKVEATAYIPLLKEISARGITCVLVKMPCNLAVLNANAADSVFGKLPNITRWYIGGHSLGGAMASSYAAKHKDKIQGLILLGAYIYGDFDSDSALIVYGTEDVHLDTSKIDPNGNVVVIQGGNHAQFANYGAQDGDGVATISREEQQDIAVEAILSFIDRRQQP